ncbi:MAG TPA: winged helix-turn-helix domain-containing protein, partial [Acetobacteraceae bacterium]|nr:winged helix-turn-helix domain-containing protein [Acetobacteraceae bacterium]
MEVAASKPVYQFEGYALDLARGALLDATGAEVSLRPKSFDLLHMLVTNAGRLLDRDTINRAIWHDVTVTDDAITQCIRDIRRAVRDADQRILKTVPRRGYIFTAQVTAGPEQSAFPFSASSLPLTDKPSIAVLAFTNMSNDPTQEYFSDGIATDITTELSHNRWLLVISRNSSFTYKGRAVDLKHVAQELGVRYILEGSVRRNGEHVRVTVQLIEAESAGHLWAHRFDRSVNDVFAVQDEIAAAVIAAILPAVNDAERRRAVRKAPENLDAWEAYQRGLNHLFRFTSDADIARAREFFGDSIRSDPAFSSAYAGLSLTYIREVLWSAQSGPLALAESWARKGVEMDPNDSESHAVLAQSMCLAGRHEEGLRRALLALDINPSSSWAHYAKGESLLFNGSAAEGREPLLMALRLDPRGPITIHFMMLLMVSYYF